MAICKKNKIYTCFVRKNVVLYIAHGRVAQLGECCIRIAEVEGSTPFASTNRVLDEHLLFCRRLCREMSALMPKQKTPSWICSKAAFYYV